MASGMKSNDVSPDMGPATGFDLGNGRGKMVSVSNLCVFFLDERPCWTFKNDLFNPFGTRSIFIY